MKVCNQCNILKPLTDYYDHPGPVDGKAGTCSECARKRSSSYRKRACLVEGCEKKQRRWLLCFRHGRQWKSGSLEHPKYGWHEGDAEPDHEVPDGRRTGTCVDCEEETRVNQFRVCPDCWTVRCVRQRVDGDWLYLI